MKRAEFLNPEVEVIKVAVEDVIKTSGLNFDPNGAGGEGSSDEETDFDDLWG